MLVVTLQASSQILTADEFAKHNIDKYDGIADKKHQYVQAAEALKDQFALDKNNQYSKVTIIDCPNMKKDALYKNVNEWFKKSFADKASTIQRDDAESGVMIVNTTLKNIVTFPHQLVSVNLIVRIDVKDNKIRLTNTIHHYIINSSTEWQVKKCAPFADVQDQLTKKVGSSAYVASCIFAETAAKKLEEASKPKVVVDDDNDDW